MSRIEESVTRYFSDLDTHTGSKFGHPKKDPSSPPLPARSSELENVPKDDEILHDLFSSERLEQAADG